MKTRKLFVLFILNLLVLTFTGCIDEQSYSNNFTFTDLEEKEQELKDYQGKIVIVDFWATWCVPCQFQMTELKKIYDNYTRNQLEIISLNIDESDTVSKIKDFKNAFKQQLDIELNWVFGKDDGTVWNKYKLEKGGIPTLYIFDQNGNIHFSHEGIAVYNEIPVGWPPDQDPPDRIKPKIDKLL